MQKTWNIVGESRTFHRNIISDKPLFLDEYKDTRINKSRTVNLYINKIYFTDNCGVAVAIHNLNNSKATDKGRYR